MASQAQLAVDAADVVLQSSQPYTNIELFRAGVIPDAAQSLHARAAAQDLGSELDSVNAAIRRLHTLRETLEVRLQFTRAYLAPVRRLPLELLSDIFIYSVADEGDPTMVALMTLSHVCSSWRTAVWSTPELWTHISAPKPAPLELIAMEVSLSGQRPLSVDSRLIRNCHSLQSLLAELLPHAERWRETHLEGNCRSYAPISPPDFRILHSASIYLTSPFFQDDKPLKFLARAPELRELSLIIALKVGDSPTLPEILGLPSLHLTKLSLRLGYRFDGPIASLIPVLALYATMLEELHIGLFSNHSMSREIGARLSASTPTLCMPSLREITLEYHAQDILDGLDLPALQNLTFKYVDVINDGDPFRSLYSLILRSKPPLRTLESDSNVVHTDFFLSSLAKLDQLESLVIIEPYREGRGVYLSTDTVMSRMTSPTVAPQLKRVEFRFPANHDTYPQSLLPSLRALQQSRKGCQIHLYRDTADGLVEVGS